MNLTACLRRAQNARDKKAERSALKASHYGPRRPLAFALAIALLATGNAEAKHYRHRDMTLCEPWIENGQFTHRFYWCRNPLVHRAFLEATGFPHGRPGWIVDHTVPLACGGADALSNLEWQNKADSDTKDRTETKGCYRGHRER